MPKETAAEWILTLVTTPDRASSTVGDLLEEGSSRGACWFWSSVLRTAASLVWRDLCDAWGRMIWLAFSGVLEFIVVAATLVNIVVMLWMAIWPYPYGPNGIYIPPWGFYGLRIAVITVVPLLVGWDAARRSKGRELAAGIALTSAFATGSAPDAFLTGALVRRMEKPYPYVQNELVVLCAVGLFVMAGALLYRLRAQRRSQADRRFHPA
jgi:hypothetical protein